MQAIVSAPVSPIALAEQQASCPSMPDCPSTPVKATPTAEPGAPVKAPRGRPPKRARDEPTLVSPASTDAESVVSAESKRKPHLVREDYQKMDNETLKKHLKLAETQVTKTLQKYNAAIDLKSVIEQVIEEKFDSEACRVAIEIEGIRKALEIPGLPQSMIDTLRASLNMLSSSVPQPKTEQTTTPTPTRPPRKTIEEMTLDELKERLPIAEKALEKCSKIKEGQTELSVAQRSAKKRFETEVDKIKTRIDSLSSSE